MKGEPMGDCMNFPDTVDEYMEQYKMTDVRQVYSNGIEYVPIFRMKQWFEHEKDQPTIQPVATDTNVGNNSEIPNSSDTVSRQAAIDAAKDWYEGLICGSVNGLIKRLNALPTVQPEPHWIPVGERLPADLSEVNVTWVNHNPEPYYEFTKDKPFTATAVYYRGEWYWYSATCVDYLAEYGKCDWNKIDEAIEIIAWMPLPKPFEGGAE